MAKRRRAKQKRGKRERGQAIEQVAESVRWFQAANGGGVVVLALLTDAGPAAYALSPLNANLMGDALRDAAQSARQSRAQ